MFLLSLLIFLLFFCFMHIYIHNPYSNWWVITGLPGGVLMIAKGNTWFGCWMHVLVFHLQRGILMLQDECFPENPIMSPFRIVFHGQIPMMRIWIWLEHHIATSNPTETIGPLDPESDLSAWFLPIFGVHFLPEFKDKCGMPLWSPSIRMMIWHWFRKSVIYFRIRSYIQPTMVYQNHESHNLKVYICRLSSSHSFKQFIALIVPASFR